MMRLRLFVLAWLTIVILSCVPVAPVAPAHTSPLQLPSPLQAPLSPLHAPPLPSLGDYPQPVPVPIYDLPPGIPLLAHRYYLPWFSGGIQPVGGGGPSEPSGGTGVGPAVLTCTSNPMAEELAQRILASPLQQRQNARCEPALSRIAQLWAEDEVRRSYTAHRTPDGVWANRFVRINGFALPAWYPDDGNSVQSLATGYDSVERVMGGWSGSAGHRAHIYGEVDFFRSQVVIGVGYAQGNNRREWVFLSAP